MKKQLIGVSVIALVASIFLIAAENLAAQATFIPSTNATTVTRTGHAELLGAVQARIATGTSLAGTLEVNIAPAVLVNDETSGIEVAGTGGLAGTSIAAVFKEDGVVVIEIPGGGGVLDSVVLTGMRISIPETETPDVRVTISSDQNTVTLSNPPLIARIEDGLVIDEDADYTFSTLLQLVVDKMDAFIFEEGWTQAFSGKVGTLGQTVPTQVIFEIDGIPENITVTFPAMVVSETSGATLTTESGDDEEFTSSSLPQRLVYEFDDDLPTSDEEIDRFEIDPELALDFPIGNGTALIKATLGPIGAAVPDTEFPSADIPRFAEQLVPPVVLPGDEPRRLHFPISSVSTDTQVALSNTTDGGALMNLWAREDDGSIVGGEGTVLVTTLQGHETLVSSLSDLFGESAASTIASVAVEAINPDVIGATIGTGSAGRFLTGEMTDRTNLYLPFDRGLASDDPIVAVNNTRETPIDVILSLRNSLGASLATVTQTLGPWATLRTSLTALFGVEPGAVPLEGYLRLTSATVFRASLVDSPGGFSEEVPGLIAFVRSRVVFPVFVLGDGWQTVVTLVSSAATPATVTVTLRDPAGGVLPGTGPYSVGVAPAERLDLDLEALFGTGQLATGYVDIEFAFQSLPIFSRSFSGMVRISRPNLSVATPLPAESDTEFFLAPMVQSATEFTALVVFNTSTSPTDIVVEVFDAGGTSLGTRAFTLDGRALDIRLVRDHIAGILASGDRLVRVSAEEGSIQVVGYRGTLMLDEMLNVPAQRVD